MTSLKMHRFEFFILQNIPHNEDARSADFDSDRIVLVVCAILHSFCTYNNIVPVSYKGYMANSTQEFNNMEVIYDSL
jgi:hypothetical protein